MRRGLVASLVLLMAGIAIGWQPAGAAIIVDNRVDWTGRPSGTAAVLGDSVGYGLVTIGGVSARLASDGWGPVRSYSLAGLHAAPEGAGDPHNVVSWINTFRAEGIVPRVAVVVSGANDVGWPQGDSVVRNQQRIEAAMAALGTTEVVWTTITHHNPAFQTAWNQALINAAAKWSNLHLCDWASEARGNAAYLSPDQVHPTATGYRAMRDRVSGCVAQYAAQARFLGAPAFGPIAASGAAGRFTPSAPPARVVDTRVAGDAVPGGTARRVHVAPVGATAAALNLTTVGAAGAGYLTAYPCNQAQPLASNLNYLGGTPVAAGVTVGVEPATGDVCVFSSQRTHLVVDVQGTYRAGGSFGFTASAPQRLADSRTTGGRVDPGAPLQVDVGASGAWLNLTAVDAEAGGYLTAYPCGTAVPTVSNVNYVGGPQAVANSASVAAAAGKVCIFASVRTHVVVDLTGRFAGAGASFVPAAPTRVLDTRPGTGGWQGTVRAGQVVNVDLTAALPSALGVVATATSITDRLSYVTVFPTGQAAPLASNLNPPGWVPTANAVTVTGRNPSVVSNGHGYHLLDVTGWWQA